MTNQELMRLMTEIGLHDGGIENWMLDNAWLRVANAVEAREREACAKVCDALQSNDGDWDSHHWNQATQRCAHAIRARGEMK